MAVSLLLSLPPPCRWISDSPISFLASVRRYKVLLRAVTPTGTGCIPLQTEGSKAVAVWWSKGACWEEANDGACSLDK